MKKYKNIEKQKSKILKNDYFNESNSIYVKNYIKVKNYEKESVRCQNAFLCFLEENLSTNNYKRAVKYVDELSEKSNNITGIWNRIFYFAGLENEEELLVIGDNFLKSKNDEYRELAKVCLILLIKQIREYLEFIEKINELECLFEMNFDKLPIEEIGKIFGTANDKDNEKLGDKLYDIVYKEGNISIEYEVEMFFKEYGF